MVWVEHGGVPAPHSAFRGGTTRRLCSGAACLPSRPPLSAVPAYSSPRFILCQLLPFTKAGSRCLLLPG